MSTKRLVINADDLGLAESVNRGILETITDGVVTSTSMIVNMPACDDAVSRLREWRARGPRAALSVGLHFNIVGGRPLTSCPTLLGSTGDFASLSALVGRALLRRLDKREVERELEAQLDRARRLLRPIGLRVTHIDSHRHTHSLPGVFDVVVRTARRHDISHVRHPYEARLLLPRARLASHLLRVVTRNRRRPDDITFTGVGAMGSPTFDRDIATMLESLPNGTTELMVHPGYDSPELAAIDFYRAPRERELRALTSPALRARIRELGVQLASFGSTAPTAARATGPAAEAS